MIPASDLLTVRLLEAAVILLIFLGSQQLIVAAALDLALQGIGVGMTETTNIFFFFPPQDQDYPACSQLLHVSPAAWVPQNSCTLWA